MHFSYEGRSLVALVTVGLLLTVMNLSGCSRAPTDEATTETRRLDEPTPENPLCPSEARNEGPLPGIEANERSVEYWLERVGDEFDLDEILLSRESIRSLNRATLLHKDGASPLNYDLTADFDEAFMRGELSNRLQWMRQQLVSGAYVLADGSGAPASLIERFDQPSDVDWNPEIRVATEQAMVRCGPTSEALHTVPVNRETNRNNCSMLEFGEPVQVLASFGDFWLARSRFTFGWIEKGTAMTAPLTQGMIADYIHGEPTTVRAPFTVSVGEAHADVPAWSELPSTTSPNEASPDGGLAVWVPITDSAPVRWELDSSSPTRRPEAFTRRSVLQTAFEFLDDPYGWGGEGGGLDCSRYLLELFEEFGLQLPRYSGNQPLAASFMIDVSEVSDTEQKALIIDAAAKKGVVLLRMSGHIMLYLGRNEQGQQRALHSFAEYLIPCPEGELNKNGDAHTLVRVGHIDVTGLELGAGTERTSFIERISEIAVLGQPRSYELMGVARPRSAAPVSVPAEEQCVDTEDSAIFTTPRIAHPGVPLRVMHVASTDPGPASFVAISPSGERYELEAEQRGAPPFTAIATIEAPEPGTWTLVYGDGDVIHACERVSVREREVPTRGGSGPAWSVRNQWSPQFENLFAAFVEKLFSYPLEEDITWGNLHSVLQEREKNLLYDYYSANEDEEIQLQPDCADLPYALRAYFAWKMGLPFGYRQCSRGREGRPPSCGDLITNLQPREYNGTADSFEYFARRGVMNSVHSGSGRTIPEDENTDYYPIPLTREAVRPGITYIDPDGHLLIVAGWIPQTLNEPGVMYAADAQPDGTIGRRRFWRGSFLFRPETDSVGAGFKAFRPVVFESRSESIVPVTNRDLERSDRYIPYSREQYEGSKDDFYERMESLENPLPVKAEMMQLALVEALEESVSRRVNSVNNCEQYMAETGYRTVDMPSGYDIFETSGAWENFSTPARDMRLLISLDTVLGFVESVRRHPARFGIRPDEVEQRIAAIESYRAQELSARTFEYARSDGSTQTLTLQDVVERRPSFEMAYNPNDCPEQRWSAPEESDEYSTCRRHAPDAQRRRMQEYRTWFENRRRPER